MRRALVGVLFVAACGGSPPPADERLEPRPQPLDAPAADGRSLGVDANYADLLTIARTLDQRRDQDSDAGCLLRRRAGGWRLDADLAAAVRPLPEPPADLDERLGGEAGPIVVLSRWGAYGEARLGALALTAVTTTLPPRREPAIVWFVTEAGVTSRSTIAPVESGAGSIQEAVARLPAEVGALFITAEAGVPLARLADVLRRVPESLFGRAGLAVPLAAGTRLPSPPPTAPIEGPETLCPEGLPALADTDPIGTLEAEPIVSSLGPLRRGVEACVGATEGPGAAGGRVSMALRIGADGRVATACVVEDETGDPALRACLVRATRSIAFPAPTPSGFVDFQLPLALSPLESQRQRPLCD